MRRQSPLINSQGFTFIEVLIAMGIIAIVLIILGMQERFKSNGYGKMVSVNKAIQLIEQEVENTNIWVASDRTTNFPPPDNSYTDGIYTIKRKISQALDDEGNSVQNLRQMEVCVSWKQGSIGNKKDSLKIITFIGKNF